MRRAAALNERQLAVLRWIADGCSSDFVELNGYKRTARALEDRKLVQVGRSRGGWHAELTNDRRYYLRNGEFGPAAGTPSTSTRDRKTKERQPKAVSETLTVTVDELLERLD